MASPRSFTGGVWACAVTSPGLGAWPGQAGIGPHHPRGCSGSDTRCPPLCLLKLTGPSQLWKIVPQSRPPSSRAFHHSCCPLLRIMLPSLTRTDSHSVIPRTPRASLGTGDHQQPGGRPEALPSIQIQIHWLSLFLFHTQITQESLKPAADCSQSTTQASREAVGFPSAAVHSRGPCHERCPQDLGATGPATLRSAG